MIATTSGAKVYYLPTAEPIFETPPESWHTRLCRRVYAGWWWARLSFAEIRFARWTRRRRADYSALLESVVADSPAQLIDRRPRKPFRPATVLDFEAARLRLRP